MKIGILTYHRAHNYGAMLQAYAMLITLRDNGHNAILIDYWPESHRVQYALLQPNRGTTLILKIKHMVANTITFLRRYRRIRKFESFCNRYLYIDNQVKYIDGQQLITEQFDCVIVGSDQIWRNTDSSSKYIGFDPVYFCQNIGTDIKCISYAASMGIIRLSPEDKNTLKQYLLRFNRILVRENSLKEVVNNLGYMSDVVLDPTLLLTNEQWNKLLPKNRFHKAPYVLYYELIPSKDATRFARSKAKDLGCKLLVMVARIPLIPKAGHISYASPIEFLQAIRDAEFVIATSFHGTVFSIIFEKQFLTIGLKQNADRVITLLQQLGLSEHYQDTPKQVAEINYAHIKTTFKNLVVRSKQLLFNSI
jgi:polysaccharide pyruvyl transferase WcaK-like protein